MRAVRASQQVPNKLRCLSGWYLYLRRTLVVLLIAYAGQHFVHYLTFSSVLYEVKTNYLHWSSTLPAISVCQVPSRRANDSSVLDGFLNGLEWPGGKYCWKCANSTSLPTKDYRQIVAERTKRCSDLFYWCRLNNREIDCCSKFKHLPTKEGICYSINSQLTGSRFTLEVSHYSKRADLSFSTSKDIQVFMHDPKDMWFSESPTRPLTIGEDLNVLYRIRQTVSEESAHLLSIQSRGCVLEGEMPAYPVYSESLCKLRCLAAAQAKMCHCSHHLLPKLVNVADCDLQGLKCLDKYFTKKKEKRLLNNCHCLPSCEDVEINIVWSNITKIIVNETKVSLSLIYPPTEKVVLKSRYQIIDIIVAFGSLLRLFTDKNVLHLFRVIFFNKGVLNSL